jgi:hypothetical protein
VWRKVRRELSLSAFVLPAPKVLPLTYTTPFVHCVNGAYQSMSRRLIVLRSRERMNDTGESCDVDPA